MKSVIVLKNKEDLSNSKLETGSSNLSARFTRCRTCI